MNQKHCQKDPLGTVPTSPWRCWGVRAVSPAGSPPGDLRNAPGSRGARVGPQGFRGPLQGQLVPREVAGSLPPHCHPEPPINPTHSQLRREAVQRPDGAGIHNGACTGGARRRAEGSSPTRPARGPGPIGTARADRCCQQR